MGNIRNDLAGMHAEYSNIGKPSADKTSPNPQITKLVLACLVRAGVDPAQIKKFLAQHNFTNEPTKRPQQKAVDSVFAKNIANITPKTMAANIAKVEGMVASRYSAKRQKHLDNLSQSNPAVAKETSTIPKEHKKEVSFARNLLGISPDATSAQINKAYKSAVLKVHPDKKGKHHNLSAKESTREMDLLKSARDLCMHYAGQK